MIQYVGIGLIALGTSILFIGKDDDNEGTAENGGNGGGCDSGSELHTVEETNRPRRVKSKPKTNTKKKGKNNGQRRDEIRPSSSGNDSGGKLHATSPDDSTEGLNDPETPTEKDNENGSENDDESGGSDDGHNVPAKPSGGTLPDGEESN